MLRPYFRPWMVLFLLAVVLFGVLSAPPPVEARPDILASWRAFYPQSKSDDVNCRLCHVNGGGGSPWNAYGWSLRQRIVDQGMTIDQAFAAVEALDADNNGKTNLQEITANVQPGWKSGPNTAYASNGTTQTVTAPAIGRLDIALDNPITPTIVSTGSLQIALTTVVTDLVAPLYATAAPSLTSALFVVDQPGQIWQVDLTTSAKRLFLDVSTQLIPLGALGPKSFDERGLLGLAFHPNYATNGLLYTFMTEPISGTADYSTVPVTATANSQSVIAQWTVTNPTNPQSVVNPASKKVLLRIDKPQFNHNGGGLAFGPDGMLYIALGDGGGADDTDGQPFIGGQPITGHGPGGNGQDATNPLGAILRIDPLGANAPNGNYGIPANNPFTGAGDARLDEIFAYGLRNPFQISFDRQSGQLYTGDVGQNKIEEVNIITAGGNYGWKYKEGTFFFDDNGTRSGFVTDIDPGNVPAGLIDPIAQYDHDEGISVIGGFVYRGSKLAGLNGVYIFGDWSRSFGTPLGRLFYLTPTNAIREFRLQGASSLPLFVHGFGQDTGGELYVLGNTTGIPFPNAEGKNTGVVLRIDRAAQALYLPLVAKPK
ncbi:MAG: CHRD domain-containing protein [Caldilinea sp. CFX5]|nr:CHRD domain-containing protein [Caldilinea sp. CFX5]